MRAPYRGEGTARPGTEATARPRPDTDEKARDPVRKRAPRARFRVGNRAVDGRETVIGLSGCGAAWIASAPYTEAESIGTVHTRRPNDQ
ncbi:hypothetical protein Sm713_19500 [Streptomyces sp. TS71-3]|nr:hypothetical protein Sm713_19500 [Streptomyces sp. TS71-3]